MRAVVHFRSGRSAELCASDVPHNDPHKLALGLCANVPTDTLFLAIGGNLVFTPQIERIEFIAEASLTKLPQE